MNGSTRSLESRVTSEMADKIVRFDTVLLYKQTGEKVEHHLAPNMTNEDRLKLFADLVGGEVCGAHIEGLNLHVYVKCNGTFEEDGMNDAASQLSGLAVAGHAILVGNELIEQWND